VKGDPVAARAVWSLADPEVETRGTFESFFAEQHVPLFRALRVIVGNAHEAEELMQDAFLAVWERWDRVGSMDSPAGYLYRSALNSARRRFRRLQVAARRTVSPREAEDLFAAADLRDQVERSLRELPERQRAAVVLVDLLDLQSAEAAEILRITPATVRSLASRARGTLRSSIEADGEESS
jgi:RNA polymerase sigma-70 factor, ECF subfamily